MAATATKRYPHEPDYIVAPGEVLQETIDALGMTQADLAKRTGLSRKTVNQIMQGREPLSHATALRLERVVGVPARFWNNLEAAYRERLARSVEKAALTQDLEWLKTIPTKELIRRRVIEGRDDAVGLLQAVLAFFGVNSAREWETLWASPQVAFRKSQVFKSHPGAVAAWIRLGELEGQRLACQPYDKDKFREALQQVRRLTVEGPEVFILKMREWCAAAGVAVVFTPEMQGVPVSGATQWLTPDKALLQLSLRFKSNDHFWFSFFHEAGHILKHGKKEKFVEDGGDHNAKEEEANRFAEDFLIPQERAQELGRLRNREQIVVLSRSIGVAPGIVLGRLQKMGVIAHQCAYNDLKERLQWSQGADGEAKIVQS
jgi:HTH-type transcriptional regulator/antitoxin HigA